MKILWVVNLLVGAAEEKVGTLSNSGQWLNAALNKEKESVAHDITICTSAESGFELQDGNIHYIILPHGKVGQYLSTQENIEAWKHVLAEEKPDLILVWGTEYEIGRCCLLANTNKIPALIYIQGVMSSIQKNYFAGLSEKDIRMFTTIFERIRKTSLIDRQGENTKSVKREHEMIRLAGNVIVENDWAAQPMPILTTLLCFTRLALLHVLGKPVSLNH